MDIPFPQNISAEELVSCNFLVNFKCSVCADVVNKFVADIGNSFPPVDNNKLKLLCTIIIAEQLPIDISTVNGIKGDIRLCPLCDCKMDRLVILEEELQKLWDYLQSKLRSRCKQMLGPDAVAGTSPTLAARTSYFEFSTDNQMGKFSTDTTMEDSPEEKEMHCDSSVEVVEETHHVSMQTDEPSFKSSLFVDDANNNLKINEHLTRSTKVSDIDITTLQDNVCENDEDEVPILEDEVVKIEEADVGTADEVTRMEEEVKTEGDQTEESGEKREMVELVTESGTQLVAVEPSAGFDGDLEKSEIQTIVLKETGIVGTYGIVEGLIKANPQIRLEEEMNFVKFETVEDLLNEATYSVIAAPDLLPDTTYVFLPSRSGSHGMLVSYPDQGLANYVHSDNTLNISAECLMASSIDDTIAVPMISETTSVFQALQNKEESSTSFTFQPQTTSIYEFPSTAEMSGGKRLKEEYRLVDPKLMFTSNDTFASLSSPQFITGSWISNIVGPTNENRQKSRRKMKRKHSFRSLDDIIHKLSVDGNKQLQCPDCHKRFSDLCQLERHVKVHKNGTVQQEVADVTAIDLSNSSITVLCSTHSEEVKLSADVVGGSFSCCGIAFNSEFEMSHHLKSHNKDTGVKAKISNCPSCNQSFDNQLELRLHNCSQYNARRSYMCSVCGLLLPSLNCFNLHRKIHHEHK